MELPSQSSGIYHDGTWYDGKDNVAVVRKSFFGRVLPIKTVQASGLKLGGSFRVISPFDTVIMRSAEIGGVVDISEHDCNNIFLDSSIVGEKIVLSDTITYGQVNLPDIKTPRLKIYGLQTRQLNIPRARIGELLVTEDAYFRDVDFSGTRIEKMEDPMFRLDDYWLDKDTLLPKKLTEKLPDFNNVMEAAKKSGKRVLASHVKTPLREDFDAFVHGNPLPFVPRSRMRHGIGDG